MFKIKNKRSIFILQQREMMLVFSKLSYLKIVVVWLKIKTHIKTQT